MNNHPQKAPDHRVSVPYRPTLPPILHNNNRLQFSEPPAQKQQQSFSDISSITNLPQIPPKSTNYLPPIIGPPIRDSVPEPSVNMRFNLPSLTNSATTGQFFSNNSSFNKNDNTPPKPWKQRSSSNSSTAEPLKSSPTVYNPYQTSSEYQKLSLQPSSKSRRSSSSSSQQAPRLPSLSRLSPLSFSASKSPPLFPKPRVYPAPLPITKSSSISNGTSPSSSSSPKLTEIVKPKPQRSTYSNIPLRPIREGKESVIPQPISPNQKQALPSINLNSHEPLSAKLPPIKGKPKLESKPIKLTKLSSLLDEEEAPLSQSAFSYHDSSDEEQYKVIDDDEDEDDEDDEDGDRLKNKPSVGDNNSTQNGASIIRPLFTMESNNTNGIFPPAPAPPLAPPPPHLMPPPPFGFPQMAPRHIKVREGISEQEFQLAAQSLQNSASRYEMKLDKVRNGINVTHLDDLSPLYDSNNQTLLRILDANASSENLPEKESEMVNELLLLNSKKYFDDLRKQKVSNDLKTFWETIVNHDNKSLGRLQDLQTNYFKKKSVKRVNKFPKSKIIQPYIIDANGTNFNQRKLKIESLFRSMEIHESKNKKNLYEKRINEIKSQIQMINDGTLDKNFKEYITSKPNKRFKLNPLKGFEKFYELNLEAIDQTNYEAQRLENWTEYLKNRSTTIYFDKLKSVYKNLNDSLTEKLNNIESFFDLQKEILNDNNEILDNKNFDINSFADNLMRFNKYNTTSDNSQLIEKKLEDLKKVIGSKDIESSDQSDNSLSNVNVPSTNPTSEVSRGGRSSVRVKKRLRNELDITIKNAKFSDDSKNLEFEIKNQELLSKLFDGCSSFDTNEEFVIISETNFSQFQNHRYKKIDIKKILMSNQAVSKYLNNNVIKKVKSRKIDSGSEINSENDSLGSSTGTSISRRGRGRNGNLPRAGGLGGFGGRGKKSNGVKGLSNDEVDHDLKLFEQLI